MKHLLSFLLSLLLVLPGCQHPGVQPAGPRRIVSFTPALTEIIFALGAGDDVVGVSDFCSYPPHAAAKQKIGGFFNPNYELLLTLHPTDIFIQGSMQDLRRFGDNNAIRIHPVTLEDWCSVTNAIQQIGASLGLPGRALKLRTDMARRWDALRADTHSRPPVPVFLCVGREAGPVAACATAGAHSFLTEALHAAGGSNICLDVVGAYPTVAAEVLSVRNPPVIIDCMPGTRLSEKQYAARLNDWQSLDTVSAVADQAVILVTNDFVMVPGPRLVEIAELFNRCLLRARSTPDDPQQ